YLFDVNDPGAAADVEAVRAELAGRKTFLLVGNKVDVGDAGAIGDAAAGDRAAGGWDARMAALRTRFPQELLISAREVRHIDVLRQRLVDQVLQGSVAGDGTIVTNARHYHALQQVAASLGTIHRGLDDRLPGDLLALDIRHCLHYLGEIT